MSTSSLMKTNIRDIDIQRKMVLLTKRTINFLKMFEEIHTKQKDNFSLQNINC